MILKVGAWYFIVTGALGVLGAFGYGIDVASLLISGVFIAVGVGLLKKLEWGRFAALGICLLGWTFGGLILLAGAGFVLLVDGARGFVALLFAGGLLSALAMILILCMALWILGIVIAFKLFWYLVSEEGCAEFGVPHGSTRTVLISTGGWFLFCMFNGMLAGSGMMRQLSSGMTASHEEDSAQSRAQERARQQEARRLEQQARADAKRAEQEAEIQAQLDALQAQEPDSESAEESGEMTPEPAEAPTLVAGDTPPPEAVPESTPAPVDTPASVQDQPQPSSRKILKCRDASGGITFTQGYCPPGSKQVEMPDQ